jgi:hypothetical protein
MSVQSTTVTPGFAVCRICFSLAPVRRSEEFIDLGVVMANLSMI